MGLKMVVEVSGWKNMLGLDCGGIVSYSLGVCVYLVGKREYLIVLEVAM